MSWLDIIKAKDYLISFSRKEGREPKYPSTPPYQYVKWALYKKKMVTGLGIMSLNNSKIVYMGHLVGILL